MRQFYSHCTHVLQKYISSFTPIIIGKIIGQNRLLCLVRAVSEKDNSKFRTGESNMKSLKFPNVMAV